MGINLSYKSLLLITILIAYAVSACSTGQKDDGTEKCVSEGDPCAANYHDDGSGNKCIAVNGTCNSEAHDDGSGTKCIFAGQACTTGYKDDGSGLKCVLTTDPCTTGYKDNGEGVCVYSSAPCALDYHDNGVGTGCIIVNGTCADDYIDDGSGQKCILNCTNEEKNNGAGVCIPLDQSCATGYMSDDAENPNQNCNDCSLDYKNDGFKACVPLSANCSKAYKDDGTGVCVLLNESCATGYTYQGDTKDNCFACDTGYRNDGEACSLTTDPCALGFKDDGNGTCVSIYDSCYAGYKDDGTGNCVLAASGSCGANFVSDGNGNCIVVIEEYIIIFIFVDVQGKPGRCDPTCAKCVAGGNCSQCKIGYSLNSISNQCVYCGGCQTCNATNPAQCTSCFAPQIINTTSKTCVDVTCTVSNCLQCNLDSSCKSCMVGYNLINGTCQQCADTNCATCSSNINTCDATGCAVGYIFSSKSKKCLPCATGCKGCKSTDISDCDGVTNGYYVVLQNGKSRAIRCFTNCDQCSNATTCIQCSSGFIASTDGTKCQLKCSDSCYQCDSSNPNKCTSCYSGTTLNATSGQCMPDLSCNANKSCVAYVNGYTIQLGMYYQCTYSDSNCVSCSFSALSTCTRCLSGYYLRDTTCQQCSDNCISCLGSKSCVACSNGYYLVKPSGASTGKCKACDSSCSTCADDSLVCTSCPANYNLQGSSCVSVHKVTVVVKLAISMADFLNYYDLLIDWFVVKVMVFRPGKAFNRKKVILKTIVSGSIDIGADLSMDDGSGVSDVANGLSSAMSSGNENIDGLVISGSAVGSDSTTTTTDSSSSSNSVGIILGIVIPLGILILIAIIVVVVKIYNRKGPEYNGKEEESQRNYSGKHFHSEDRQSEKV